MTPKFSKLAPLFRGPFLRKVATNAHYPELAERLNHCDLGHLLSLPLWEIFEEVHSMMLSKYRCEYVFKNILTCEWIAPDPALERSFITDEFRIGKSRVDLAVFAKTSFAFEIKTDYDSLARLGTQTADYIKVFDMVYILTSKRFRDLALQSAPRTVGVLCLNEDGSVEALRQSESHGNMIDLKAAQSCLRQAEMIELVERLTGTKVTAPNSQVFTECRKHFKQMLPFEVHRAFVEGMRARRFPEANIALLNDAPPSLKHASLTLRGTKQDIANVRKNLTIVPVSQSHLSAAYEHLPSVLERKAKRIASSP